MPDTVYTGVIQDKGGAVYNLRAYGALGNGDKDDTEAIRNAIAAVPDGGTLYIPTGKFCITDTIHINRPISIEGSGPGSAFWVDLNSATKPGIVIGLVNPVEGGVTSVAHNQSYRNFGVFGPAPTSTKPTCQYGLALYHCARSRFENIHVRPGSSEHAIVIGGCLYCHFNFVVTNNHQYGYPSGSGTWNGAAILVADLTSSGSNMPTNICVFDCTLQGGVGGGLAFKPQPQGGGNNAITGTYEGFAGATGTLYGTGHPLLVDGCRGFDLHDLHVEASLIGSVIRNCSAFTVRQSGFHDWKDANQQTHLEQLTIQASADFTIDRVTVGYLTIEPTCVRYQVENILGQKNAYSQPRRQDSFLTTFQDPSQGGVIASTGMARFTTENLVPNGDLSRWPLGFGYAGTQPGLARTGTSPGDATRRFNRYAAKVTGGDVSRPEDRATLVIGVPDSTQYVGQPVTIWADIKRASGAEITVGVYEYLATRYRWLAYVPATETEWVRVALTYYPILTSQGGTPTPDPWSIVITGVSNAAYTYYLGGVGALVGVAAPMGVQSPAPSLQSGVQLMGKRIEYGSGAPTSGEWQQGDIMFNLAPTAGGTVGWVCTGTGSPGTWKTFGAIAA
jgi:hypothetical protein